MSEYNMVQDEINPIGGLWGDCGIGLQHGVREMRYRTSGSSGHEMPMGKGGKKMRLDNKDPFEGLVIHQVV